MDAQGTAGVAEARSGDSTAEERRAAGRLVRKEVPRSSHAEWTPPRDRADPVALLESQATTRVPELVPIRYGRMLSSPLAFFRGAALIMASDLSRTPRTGITVQACGDAHLSNFGVFGSPERRQVFDLNDFDETLPGPWEWDVKRLAASIEIAARHRGFAAAERRAAVRATVAAYRERMAALAAMRELDVWYASIDADMILAALHSSDDRTTKRDVERVLTRARTRDSNRAYAKLTHLVDGRPRIISDPPLIVPLDELLPASIERDAAREGVRAILDDYRSSVTSEHRALLGRYRLIDIAQKVVGVGSVGTHAWIALLLGTRSDDALFLQVKEAQPSVLAGFLPAPSLSEGERVVRGQRLMQATSDIFLGWVSIPGADGVRRDAYVRQLHDWKGSADIETMSPDGLSRYGYVCASTLARAHARSGDRIAIAAYLGSGAAFDDAIVCFAGAYADQNERDFEALAVAAAEGRIAVQTGI